MSYKISYNPEMKVRFPRQRSPSSTICWISLAVVFVLTAVLICVKPMYEKRFPHKLEVTRAAFTEMVEDLSAGETMIEAFSDFCVRIIKNENETAY